jgi:hypothetical protein
MLGPVATPWRQASKLHEEARAVLGGLNHPPALPGH